MRRSSARIVRFCSCQEIVKPTPLTDPRPSPQPSWGGPACCCVLWTTRRATPSTCSPTAAPASCWTPWLGWDTGRCCVWAHPGEGVTVIFYFLGLSFRTSCELLKELKISVSWWSSGQRYIPYNLNAPGLTQGPACHILLSPSVWFPVYMCISNYLTKANGSKTFLKMTMTATWLCRGNIPVTLNNQYTLL